MQAQQLSSWTAPALAFCLSLLLSVTLAPILGLVAYQQYDFWLLWLVTMLVLALPFILLEIALARRAKSTPLQAFLQLTREADRSTKWRLIGWASLVFIPFIAGSLLNFAVTQIQYTLDIDVNSRILLLIFAVIAVALSMVPRIALLAITVIATLAFAVVSIVNSAVGEWQWTGIEFAEWAKVVTLTLVTGGLGAGLYWQSALQHAKQQQKTSHIVLPIWIAQAIGLGSVIFVPDIESSIQAISFLVAVFGLSALLLQFVREQALERQLPVLMQALVLLIPLLIWAVPFSSMYFYALVILYGLVLCLVNTIFVGWLMKISHLRKSLNFDNELLYNLWRISVRIVLPVSIIVALIAWFNTAVGG